MLTLKNLGKYAIASIIALITLASSCKTVSAPVLSSKPQTEQLAITELMAQKVVNPLQKIQVSCATNEVDNQNLTYIWTSSGGVIQGDDTIVTWIAPETAGDYTVDVTVSDGEGNKVTKSVIITVSSKPSERPVITAITVNTPDNIETTINPLAEPKEKEQQIHVKVLHTSDIECIATDPDGDELGYAWSDTGGKILGKGNKVSWLAPGVPGNYKVTVTVTGGRGGKAQASVDFRVTMPTVM